MNIGADSRGVRRLQTRKVHSMKLTELAGAAFPELEGQMDGSAGALEISGLSSDSRLVPGSSPMQSGLYVNLSGLNAMERRLNTIAMNVANVNTVGYRAEEVSFQTLVTHKDQKAVSYVSSGNDFVSRQTGPMTRTGNPLDVAVTGNAWLALQGPNGTIYTRDGRLNMQSSGALQSVNGYPVLDAGGSGILLDPDGGPPVIAKDGMITQGGRQVGAIGLFSISDDAKLQRANNSGVIPDKSATPVLDFGANGIEQGFVEGANINPVLELAKLISVQRAFESLTTETTDSETSLKDAIKTLGGS